MLTGYKLATSLTQIEASLPLQPPMIRGSPTNSTLQPYAVLVFLAQQQNSELF